MADKPISQSDTRWVKKKGQAGYVEQISTGKRVTGKVAITQGTKTNAAGTTASYKKGANADWGKPAAKGAGSPGGATPAKKPTPSGTGRVSPRAGNNSSGKSNFNGSQTATPKPTTSKPTRTPAKKKSAAVAAGVANGQVPRPYRSYTGGAASSAAKKSPFVGGAGGGTFAAPKKKPTISGSGSASAGTRKSADLSVAGARRGIGNVKKAVSGVEKNIAKTANRGKKKAGKTAKSIADRIVNG